MAPLAQKVAMSVGDEGLILRPVQTSREAASSVTKIDYATHRISVSGPPSQPSTVDEVVVPGIVGLLPLAKSAHLIVVTKAERVARVWGRDVFAVRDVGLIELKGKGEAENGLKAVGKVVAKVGAGGEGGEVEDGGGGDETEGEVSDVEVTDDEDAGPAGGGGNEKALEVPKQGPGLLRTGAGVVGGVVASPYRLGRFAGRWIAKGVRGGGVQASTAGATPDVAATDHAVESTPIGDEGEAEGTKRQVPQTDEEKEDHSQSVIDSLTPRILRSARLYFASSGFFFSYTHDLSGCLTQKSEYAGTTSLWKRFDPTFFWNRHLLAPFIEAGADELALPLMQGFVGQRAFSIEKTGEGQEDVVAGAVQEVGEVVAAQETPAPKKEVAEDEKERNEFLLTLISRRSTRRAGLRYRRRGIDDDGNVANFVETEQILSSQTWNQSDTASSLLQIRGSIPLFFNQSPYSFKPQPIPFGSEATTHAAFMAHFRALKKRYGDVQVASLVDKSATEVGIGELYGKHVQMANNGSGIDGSQIGFEWFDFHHQCKGMKFENVSILTDALEAQLKSHGWITKQNDRNTRLQRGVLRTNCMDCLDRTNVVQSAVAGWALERQLAELGLHVDLKKDPKTQWFNTLWADNGDAVSRQYAGTAALKGDFTRTRKRKWTGALSDFSLTLTRYYNNVFGDYFMQACIDYFLGNVEKGVFEEFETDMMTEDFAMDVRRVRANGIETCAKIVLEDGEVGSLKGGWTLSCPREANTLRTLPFEECVLLLAGTAMVFCRFDWDVEKVVSFERVDLRDVVAIWRGAYVTSALGEAHLDEARNVGFAVRYRVDGGRGMVRRNTRTIGNKGDGESKESEKEKKADKKKEDETKVLAFKALPPKAAASKGRENDASALSELELVKGICSELYQVMAALKIRDGETQEEIQSVEEKAVLSAAEARKATGWGESIGYSLKRMVWA